MSRLQDLINELCPDGVEYKEIKEFANVSIGEFVHKNKQSPDAPYPVFNGGTSNTGFYYNYNRTANKIIISARGANAGFVNRVFTNFWSGNSCYTIEVSDESVNWNYLYYWLKSKEGKLLDEQQKGGIPAVSKKQVEEFLTPIPPLSVQREIVRILDNFTELTARKKQYEYYRKTLLTFGDEVHKINLKALFDIKNGYTPSKSKAEFWSSDDLPWFRMEDIRENGRILNDAIKKVSLSAVKGKPFPKNSIIVSTSATIGEHALITCESLANQRFTYLMLKEEYKKDFDIKFLFYYCFKLDEYCLTYLNQGNFASVDMRKFLKFEFPIISIEEQQRIVDILDRFDTLCNDLTGGLPAEIAARQKQYEYYRDKLLQFRIKNV